MGQVGGCFLLLRWGNDDTCSPPRGQVCCTRPSPCPSERTRALPGGAQAAECSPGPASRLLTVHASPCLFGLRFSDIPGRSWTLRSRKIPTTLPFRPGTRGDLNPCQALGSLLGKCQDGTPLLNGETENTGGGEQGRTAYFQGWHVL